MRCDWGRAFGDWRVCVFVCVCVCLCLTHSNAACQHPYTHTACHSPQWASPPCLSEPLALTVRRADGAHGCAGLWAVQMWRQTPRALVGFIPRLHLPDPSSPGALLYRRFWSVWLRGEYSIILTKACFMHRDFLDVYTHRSPPSVIQHIDANRCGGPTDITPIRATGETP